MLPLTSHDSRRPRHPRRHRQRGLLRHLPPPTPGLLRLQPPLRRPQGLRWRPSDLQPQHQRHRPQPEQKARLPLRSHLRLCPLRRGRRRRRHIRRFRPGRRELHPALRRGVELRPAAGLCGGIRPEEEQQHAGGDRHGDEGGGEDRGPEDEEDGNQGAVRGDQRRRAQGEEGGSGGFAGRRLQGEAPD